MTPTLRNTALLSLLLASPLLAQEPPFEGQGGIQPIIEEPSDAPAFEASIDFTTRQLTYGLVDNANPIFTLAGLVEWKGFAFEAAAIFDTTDWGERHGGYGDRQWNYQEFAFGPSYTYVLEDLLPTPLELGLNYTYAYHPRTSTWKGYENPDTQYINAGLKLPDLFLEPELTAEFDIDDECGAMYFRLQGTHAISLIEDVLDLELSGGVGLGNPKRNRFDADVDRWGFKDIGVSLALVWQPLDNLTITPYIALYEQLDGSLRDAARHYIEDEKHPSTQLVGGLALTASF